MEGTVWPAQPFSPMNERQKTFSDLSLEEKRSLVLKLQQSRDLLLSESRSKQNRKRTSSGRPRKKNLFTFDDPALQAMFELLPVDYRKKFGKK